MIRFVVYYLCIARNGCLVLVSCLFVFWLTWFDFCFGDLGYSLDFDYFSYVGCLVVWWCCFDCLVWFCILFSVCWLFNIYLGSVIYCMFMFGWLVLTLVWDWLLVIQLVYVCHCLMCCLFECLRFCLLCLLVFGCVLCICSVSILWGLLIGGIGLPLLICIIDLFVCLLLVLRMNDWI